MRETQFVRVAIDNYGRLFSLNNKYEVELVVPAGIPRDLHSSIDQNAVLLHFCQSLEHVRRPIQAMSQAHLLSP